MTETKRLNPISVLNLCFILFIAPALAEESIVPVQGIAMYDDLKYPSNFTNFDYTNPNAPKGGSIKLSALGTFDSFNQFIIKGIPANGLSLIYDSLMARAEDEPFSQYGLLAQSIEIPKDRSWIIFNLNPKAKFSDGKPVTAKDVIFTFNKLRTEGNPFYRTYYADIDKIEALSQQRVKFNFKETENRELPLIIGEVPILPAHYWKDRDFKKASLEIPIGSGPYLIDSFNAGKTISYKRNPDYWGKDLAVNKGRYNFDYQIYDYYRDNTVAMEAFKAGEYDFRLENSSKRWATEYQGQAFDQQKIITKEHEHSNPTGMQAFVLNTRLEKFADPRVRQALALVFDFEWTNKNIFYGAYTRTQSFFSNSEMAATELPDEQEKAILEPIKNQVPPEVFTQIYQAPKTNGSGKIYNQLRTARRLLQQAGWILKNGKLINIHSKKPFKIEFLIYASSSERIISPFARNIERLGIEVSIRLVDTSQYIKRLRNFNFDAVIYIFGQSSSPGNEQRNFWHSSTANTAGSHNLIGIKNPAVDYLVEQIIQAPNRQQLIKRTKALDRVLLWNHYVIPQFHINKYRFAFKNKFSMPATTPKYSLGLSTWWLKASQPEPTE